MATLPKVLINRADYQNGRGVALRLRTQVPYQEHVPPDVTACIFWLKNRDPARWRDAWQVERTMGKYIISDRPMTEEEWTKERATLIDVTPDKFDD